MYYIGFDDNKQMVLYKINSAGFKVEEKQLTEGECKKQFKKQVKKLKQLVSEKALYFKCYVPVN